MATTMKVKVTFTEGILGMMPAKKDILSEYIASKAPDAATRAEEVEALGAEEVERKEMTIFPRDEQGRPFLYNYQIKGAFKDICGMLRNADGTKSKELKAYKKNIDGLIFIKDRQNVIKYTGEIETCQRPLRASTPQGERIALASSEEIPAGATMEFEVQLLKDSLKDLVIEWLDYGKLRGFGQWRNSGKGTFEYKLI